MIKHWSKVEKTNMGCNMKYEGLLLNDKCADIKKSLIETLITHSTQHSCCVLVGGF